MIKIPSNFFQVGSTEPTTTRRKCVICKATTKINLEWVMWYLCVTCDLPSDIAHLMLEYYVSDPILFDRKGYDPSESINLNHPVMYILPDGETNLTYAGKSKSFQYIKNEHTGKLKRVPVKTPRSKQSVWVCRSIKCGWKYFKISGVTPSPFNQQIQLRKKKKIGNILDNESDIVHWIPKLMMTTKLDE
jgi:hypothetical protein